MSNIKLVIIICKLTDCICLYLLELTVTVFTGGQPLYVSKALQKAKIVVNEDGTKAAAATSECFVQ